MGRAACGQLGLLAPDPGGWSFSCQAHGHVMRYEDSNSGERGEASESEFAVSISYFVRGGNRNVSLSLLPPQHCPLPLPAPVPAGAGQEPERPLVPTARAASAARPPATPKVTLLCGGHSPEVLEVFREVLLVFFPETRSQDPVFRVSDSSNQTTTKAILLNERPASPCPWCCRQTRRSGRGPDLPHPRQTPVKTKVRAAPRPQGPGQQRLDLWPSKL